jgi:aspartate/methionine/tyrosine aminotransferase
MTHEWSNRRHPAARLDGVAITGIREVHEALLRWSAPGQTPVPFHLGMPDFDTPQHIKDAAHAALEAGDVRYTSSLGTAGARAAVARKLQRENAIAVDPDSQVILTCVANEAISGAIFALVDPGDEVILPDPAWPHYEYCIRMAGGVPVPCALREERGFEMGPDEVGALWSRRTRMVIINSPHNPTGAMMSRDAIAAIATLARERGAWLLSDEAYDRIVYEGEHVSAGSLPGMADTVLTAGCLSKTYAMTGWRLGFLAGPPAVIEAVNRVHLYTVTCAVSFVQSAAIAALDGSQACVEAMRQEYRRRRDLIVALLGEIPGVRVQVPPGAFYVFPNVSAFGRPSRDIAMYLVKRKGVGAVHGTAFGAAGEGHLRLVYACSEAQIREGMARMTAGMAELAAATA